MNKLDLDYQALLQDILDNGAEKKDRTGTGTISVFGRQIRHNMKDGFPLLTTKKMPFKTIVTELLWFLRGDTNIKYLVDNNCHIWDGDAYKNYENNWLKENPPFAGPYTDPCLTQEEFIDKIKTDDEFAKKWGDLGPIYGKQWRKWKQKDILEWGYKEGEVEIDQTQNLINDLKTNPDSRRLMVNAWNVGELDQMVLPPCHYGFQVYTRELSLEERKQIFEDRGYVCDVWPFSGDWHGEYDGFGIPRRAISLMWNQRSVDTFLGLPFNIASYGLLLEIIAKEVNMVPDELIGNLGDVHLYSNHIDAAKEQIGRELTFDEFWDSLTPKQKGSMEKPYEGETYNGIDSRIELMNIISEIHNIPTRTREPYPLPIVSINTEFWKTQSGECGVGPLDTNLQGFEISDFEIENYQSHPTIKAPLSN
jgi:thymidylate synthase